MPQTNPALSGLKDRTILVTGGHGFIGAHLCRRLIGEGSIVHATSRTLRRNEGAGPAWLAADFSDMAQAREVLGAVKPDVIYHLAGAVGAGPSLDLVLPTFHSLLTSTVNVLAAAQEHGAPRVILAGSFTEPPPGTDWPVPGSPYAAGKWAASAYGRMFHALYDAPVSILRPMMAYGPGQAAGKLVPSVIAALLKGEAPKLSSGRAKADWVYIDDVVDAFTAAAIAPRALGATLDLGSGQLTSFREVVERIVARSGAKVAPYFGALADRPSELEVVADTKATAEKIGWRASTSLDDGLRATIEAARAA
jgi:nucleoside-diphosphate-sugar epimerase